MKNENNSSLANSTTADSKTSNANIGVLKRRLRKEAKDKYWNYKPQDAVEGPMDFRVLCNVLGAHGFR